MRNGNKTVISSSELAVLTCLHHRRSPAELTTIELAEISHSTGIRDNDEVLRALYTLEGKNLVAPEPLGDFTSNHWQITENGVRALQLVSSN